MGTAAVRETLGSRRLRRQGSSIEGFEALSDSHVRLYLEGTTVRPWALEGRPCVFCNRGPQPEVVDRVYVALRDTEEAGSAQRLVGLLSLMLVNGADAPHAHAS